MHLFWQWRQVLGAAAGCCINSANGSCCLCLLTAQANPFSWRASTYSSQKFLCMVGIWAKGKSWVIFRVNSAVERSLETGSVLLTKARTGSPEDMWSTSLLVGLHVCVKLLEMLHNRNERDSGRGSVELWVNQAFRKKSFALNPESSVLSLFYLNLRPKPIYKNTIMDYVCLTAQSFHGKICFTYIPLPFSLYISIKI